MAAIGIAIVIFIATGVLGFLGKKLVDMVQTKTKKHRQDHDFIALRKEQQSKRDDEHQLLMIHSALLIESNISQIASSLLRQHKEYMSKGSISENEFKTWQRMYKSYAAMGGNGFMAKLKEEMETLPIEL